MTTEHPYDKWCGCNECYQKKRLLENKTSPFARCDECGSELIVRGFPDHNERIECKKNSNHKW
jgi:PHP family Zn ribbon phosphoesterase